MTARLYLDGCSFTYGTGLSQQSTLGHLFADSGGYQVTNNSRTAKSNLAIALDTYDNIANHDVIVIGWTFSARTYLKYHNRDLDFLPSNWIKHSFVSPISPMDDFRGIEKSYEDYYKQLYSLFDIDHYDKVSNMLISMTYQMALNLNKKIVFFSWEKRDVTIPLLYPHAPAQHRLTCGHLNASGTEYLYNTLQALLGEQ